MNFLLKKGSMALYQCRKTGMWIRWLAQCWLNSSYQPFLLCGVSLTSGISIKPFQSIRPISTKLCACRPFRPNTGKPCGACSVWHWFSFCKHFNCLTTLPLGKILLLMETFQHSPRIRFQHITPCGHVTQKLGVLSDLLSFSFIAIF